MNNIVRILDTIALTVDLSEHGLFRGQVGTVVETLGENTFEVEFVDNNGHTYATLPLHSNQFLILHHDPVKAI